jgi:hypothetical protein
LSSVHHPEPTHNLGRGSTTQSFIPAYARRTQARVTRPPVVPSFIQDPMAA